MHVEKDATGEKWHVSDGYPRSVTDVFQQAYGEVDAIFAIKVPNSDNSYKVFVLTAGNLISQYSIMLRNGNAQPFISIDFLRKDVRSYFDQVVDRPIKSALVLGDKAILISNDLTCFFEVRKNTVFGTLQEACTDLQMWVRSWGVHFCHAI